MEPALLDGDHLVVSRLLPRVGRPRRGQIVFLRPSFTGDAKRECIKRIIGLPYNHVTVIAGSVLIDGAPLKEPYLIPSEADAERALHAASLAITPSADVTLGPDQYFVLGDNRARSTDSRILGPADSRDIAGVALYRYTPANRRGWLDA